MIILYSKDKEIFFRCKKEWYTKHGYFGAILSRIHFKQDILFYFLKKDNNKYTSLPPPLCSLRVSSCSFWLYQSNLGRVLSVCFKLEWGGICPCFLLHLDLLSQTPPPNLFRPLHGEKILFYTWSLGSRLSDLIHRLPLSDLVHTTSFPSWVLPLQQSSSVPGRQFRDSEDGCVLCGSSSWFSAVWGCNQISLGTPPLLSQPARTQRFHENCDTFFLRNLCAVEL